MDASNVKTEIMVNQKKKKSGCFITIYQRIGRLFRRLRKRVTKRNVVCPTKGQMSPEPQRVDKTIFESFEIVNDDTPRAEEMPESGKDYEDVIENKDLRSDEVTSTEFKENEDAEEKKSQQSELEDNHGEQEIEKLAQNVVQGTLNNMRAMLLLEKAKEIQPKVEEDVDSVYENEDLRMKIETIVFSDHEEDEYW